MGSLLSSRYSPGVGLEVADGWDALKVAGAPCGIVVSSATQRCPLAARRIADADAGEVESGPQRRLKIHVI